MSLAQFQCFEDHLTVCFLINLLIKLKNVLKDILKLMKKSVKVVL